MSAPSDGSIRVWHYDGVRAVRRIAQLVDQGDSFVLEEGALASGPWPFKDLVAHGVIEGRPQFGLRKHPGWRIGLTEDAPEAIAAKLPGVKRYGGPIDRIGLIPAALVFALVSVVVVLVVMSTPSLVVQVIPRATERQLGELMVGDFGLQHCETPEGNAALKALLGRLGADRDTKVTIVNFPVPNAMTLPGRQIVLFSGLFDKASSVDEVAGVLGHELGHAENRDPLEGLIRERGIGVLLGGIDVGGYAQALASNSYSRADESRADSFSVEMLHRANVSTRDAAGFFQRMERAGPQLGGMGRVLNYFESHPVDAERAATFTAGVKPGTTPALGAAQWQALKTICARVPKAKFSF